VAWNVKRRDTNWDKLAIDFNGPYSSSGGKLIVVLVDYFSRYLFAEFIRSTDFVSLKAFLDKIFARFALPKTIRSDNGPPFNGAEYSIYLESLSIVPEFSTPGFLEQNGSS
jgi:putative transposase